MDKDKQGTNESQSEHTLSPKQRENITTEEDKLLLKSTPPSNEVIIITDDEDEEEPTLKKPKLVSPRVNVGSFDELGIVVTKDNNVGDVAASADLNVSSTDLKGEKKDDVENVDLKGKKKDDVENVDLKGKKKDDVETVVESSSPTSRAGYGHVTLEELGVTVEDLKKIPWEAFDPTWELRNDPWLRGHVEDLASPKKDDADS